MMVNDNSDSPPVNEVEEEQLQLKPLADDAEVESVEAPKAEAPLAPPTTPPKKPTPSVAPVLSQEEVRTQLEQARAQVAENARVSTQLQQQQLEMQRHRDAVALEDQVSRGRAELEQQGWAPEQIHTWAQSQRAVVNERQELARQRSGIQAHMQSVQVEADAKVQVATLLAEEHGVSIKELMKLSSPEAMKIAGLEHQMGKKQEAAVPPQNFDQGAKGTPHAIGSDARRAVLRTLNRPWTDKEADEMKILMG